MVRLTSVLAILAAAITTPQLARANSLQCLFTQECEAGKSCTQTDMSGRLSIGDNDQVTFQTALGPSDGVILPGGADDTLHVVTFPVNRSAELISIFADGSARYTLQGFTDQAFTLTLLGQCGETE